MSPLSPGFIMLVRVEAWRRSSLRWGRRASVDASEHSASGPPIAKRGGTGPAAAPPRFEIIG